jgi:hypothetical protein
MRAMPDQSALHSVKTYRLAPEGYTAARNRQLRQKIAVFAGLLIFVLALQHQALEKSWQTGSLASLVPVGIIFLVFSVSISFGVKLGLRRNQDAWNTYELLIGEEFMIRRIKDFPELEIQRHEVTAIRESVVGIQVETSRKDRTIGIARALIGYEDVKERLSSWEISIQKSPEGWGTPAPWVRLLPLVFLLFFAGLYFASRSWIIVSLAVPLLAGLSWSIWLTQKSVQISAATKRVSALAALPLLAIVVKLVYSIINWH